MLKLILQKPDTLGALTSMLCVIHCLATPFIFLMYTCTDCEKTPGWWGNLDYFLLLISFLAVTRSVKTTSKNFIKSGLWISWVALFLLILNEKIHFLELPEILTYIAAFSLAALHIYNLKYCQCKTDNCCTHKELKHE